MKLSLPLKQNMPFASNPPTAELDGSEILANDVIFPWEYNPHRVRLWVIGHEFGALCAVWADCEQDALDAACDNGMLSAFEVEDSDFAEMSEEERESMSMLGNAGEPHDLGMAWIGEVSNNTIESNPRLLVAFSAAREAFKDNLKDYL